VAAVADRRANLRPNAKLHRKGGAAKMYWMGRHGWGGFGFFFLSDGWGGRGSTTTNSRLATTPQSFNRGNDENDALSPRLNRQPGMHGCEWK